MKGLILNMAGGDDLPLTKDNIPKDPKSKEYIEFRDRAAYVYITGTFPTHVRKYFTQLLRAATSAASGKALDGRGGHLKVEEDVADILRLPEHPMVRKARSYIDQGYRLAQPTSHKDRRPYGKVELVNPEDGNHVTVQSDGSVL